jgi:hypothetical protein
LARFEMGVRVGDGYLFDDVRIGGDMVAEARGQHDARAAGERDICLVYEK